MSVLEIVHYPNPLLKERSDPIEVFDRELKELADNMIETMYDAQGIGLAAVQIAELKRILVLDVNRGTEEDEESNSSETAEIYINPEILSHSGKTQFEEGCLSIPGIHGIVNRHEKITLSYQDLEGKQCECEAEGLRAIVLQHEIDHLNGKLFLDHLNPFRRSTLVKKYNKERQKRLLSEQE